MTHGYLHVCTIRLFIDVRRGIKLFGRRATEELERVNVDGSREGLTQRHTYHPHWHGDAEGGRSSAAPLMVDSNPSPSHAGTARSHTSKISELPPGRVVPVVARGWLAILTVCVCMYVCACARACACACARVCVGGERGACVSACVRAFQVLNCCFGCSGAGWPCSR